MHNKSTWLLALAFGALTVGSACKKKGNDTSKQPDGSATASTPSTPTPSKPTTPEPVEAPSDQIAVGRDIYFKTADGTVRSWGANDMLTKEQFMAGGPAVLSQLANTKHLATGGGQTMCAVMKDGAAKCWGVGATGELGDGKESKSKTPVVVPDVANATAIGIGAYFVCALIGDGSVKCWGNNTSHESSVEDKPNLVTPTTMPGVTGVQQLAVGGRSTCGRAKDGSVKCWGADCGAPEPGLCSKPFTVPQFAGATDIAAGNKSVCAVVKDSSVQCFGSNDFGLRGNGTTTTEAFNNITPVKGLTGVKSLAAGQQHWCALLKDGTVQCWGLNEHGQLGDPALPTGDGEKGAMRTSPAPVAGIAGATSLACGNATCCAQLEDKSIKCWGQNALQSLFGDANNSIEQTATPVVVKMQ